MFIFLAQHKGVRNRGSRDGQRSHAKAISAGPPNHHVARRPWTNKPRFRRVQTGLTADHVQLWFLAEQNDHKSPYHRHFFTPTQCTRIPPQHHSAAAPAGSPKCRCSRRPDVIREIRPSRQEPSASCQLPSIYRAGSVSPGNWWELCVPAKCSHVLAIKR